MSEIALLVIGAVLGLLASQGNEYFRLWREEKRAIGRALKTLLVVRRYLYSLKRIKELITEYFNPPAQQLVQFQHSLQVFILPSTTGLLGKYEEAIDVISGIKPLLGLSLAQKTQLMPMIMSYSQLAMQDKQASAIWLNIQEHISNLTDLDDLILELAELHSMDTRDKVKRYLEESLEVPSDIEKLLKEQAKVNGLPQK